MGEGIYTLEANIVAVGDQSRLCARVLDRSLNQREIRRTIVVQDQEPVPTADDGVIDGVLDAFSSRQHRGEFSARVGGVGESDLRGDRRSGRDEDVGVTSGAAHGKPEPFVGFVEHLLCGPTRAEAVAPHRIGTPRLIDGGVVDAGVVGRPGDSPGDAGNLIGVELAGA